ncbi:MAG: MBL fold metallo-hydrolase [Bacteroidia bacterium]
MSLQIASLNSGSNGNCYYISSGTDAVLIDAGLSCRETEKRMKRLGLEMDRVSALFITHEHSDHIRGVEGISRKHNLPVYITESTYKHSRLGIHKDLLRNFKAGEEINAGTLSVIPFAKLHDAVDPHSFLVKGMGITIGVLTDIGYACEEVTRHFQQCDAAFLECNYDEDMLENGRYPVYLKNRIRSEKGHLSNKQAAELLVHKSASLHTLLLSHLSKDNNAPELALELIRKYAGNTFVEVASRYAETPVYEIGKNGITPKPGKNKAGSAQMALF